MQKNRSLVAHALLLTALLTPVCSGAADSLSGRPSEEPLEIPPYLRPQEPNSPFQLPALPERLRQSSYAPRFLLRQVRFEGNTVFSEERLQESASEFIGKQVSMADLEEIRYRVTRLYVDNGYVNSGAVLKAGQRSDDGTISFVVIEGRLIDVQVSGSGRLRQEYISKRLQPDSHAPLNMSELQERFLLLLQDPLIGKMDGRISPGPQPGTALLDLEVTRRRPYELGITLDNHRPASMGETQATIFGTLRNLTGFGDRLRSSFSASDGIQDGEVDFEIPLNRSNTRFGLRYSYSESAILEEPLDSIDIESESEGFSVSLTQPLFTSLRRLVEMGVTCASRRSLTSLFGRPFSFSPGAEEGRSRVSVVRFHQFWQERGERQALALRSTFNVGIDAFDATIHDDGEPDSRFFSWLLQGQYARRLGERFGQLVVRADLQLADDELLSLEQFSVGGAASVRGYRENERVNDNGYLLSLEWQYPIWSDEGGEGASSFAVAPFVDYGNAWDKEKDERRNPLFSAGVGFLWSSRHVEAKLYLAHDIEEATEKSEHHLQDEGVHFLLTWKL